MKKISDTCLTLEGQNQSYQKERGKETVLKHLSYDINVLRRNNDSKMSWQDWNSLIMYVSGVFGKNHLMVYQD
jgi:hypothetical protein